MFGIWTKVRSLRAMARAMVLGGAAGREAIPAQLAMLHRFEAQASPAPAVPASYRVQVYRRGDEQRWLALLNASGEFGHWDRSRLTENVLSGLIPSGGIFLLAGDMAGDAVVACAATCAWRRFAPYAVLTYVVVLDKHRGQGLGTAVTHAAMEAARNAGFPGILLHTDDHRLAAIRTYLKLGFVPMTHGDPAMEARWRRVFDEIGEPLPESVASADA